MTAEALVKQQQTFDLALVLLKHTSNAEVLAEIQLWLDQSKLSTCQSLIDEAYAAMRNIAMRTD